MLLSTYMELYDVMLPSDGDMTFVLTTLQPLVLQKYFYIHIVLNGVVTGVW